MNVVVKEPVSRKLLRFLVIVSWVCSVLVSGFFPSSENQDLMSWQKSGLAKHIVRGSAEIGRHSSLILTHRGSESLHSAVITTLV